MNESSIRAGQRKSSWPEMMDTEEEMSKSENLIRVRSYLGDRVCRAPANKRLIGPPREREREREAAGKKGAPSFVD